VTSAYHGGTSWQGIPEAFQVRCHDTMPVRFRKGGRQDVTGFQCGIARRGGQGSGEGIGMVATGNGSGQASGTVSESYREAFHETAPTPFRQGLGGRATRFQTGSPPIPRRRHGHGSSMVPQPHLETLSLGQPTLPEPAEKNLRQTCEQRASQSQVILKALAVQNRTKVSVLFELRTRRANRARFAY
jgi:hypothetical protein